MQKETKKLIEGHVYAVLLDDIDVKSIKYIDGSYGNWESDLEWTIKKRVQEESNEKIDFSEAYTLVRYVGDNTFIEYYTSGEYPIYLNKNYKYKKDTIDKFLFIDSVNLIEPDDLVFKSLGKQNYEEIAEYISKLNSVAKESIEYKVKLKLEEDYIRATGENLYYDYVLKKTR